MVKNFYALRLNKSRKYKRASFGVVRRFGGRILGDRSKWFDSDDGSKTG